MVSSRFKAVLPSPTVSLNNKFAELKEKGENAISFGVGEPDATTPEIVIDYAAQKAREGKTHYTSSLGIKELREKIAQKYSSMTGKGVVPKNVIVTIVKFAVNMAVQLPLTLNHLWQTR